MNIYIYIACPAILKFMPREKAQRLWFIILWLIFIVLLQDYWYPSGTAEPLFLGLPHWWWMGLSAVIFSVIIVSIYMLKYWPLPEEESSGST